MSVMSTKEKFSNELEKKVSKYKLKKFNLEGGITRAGKDSDMFVLNSDIPDVKLREGDEHVKRVAVSVGLASRLTGSEDLMGEFIEELVESFIDETGCNNFTFKAPCSDSYCRLFEDRNAFEIRLYGIG